MNAPPHSPTECALPSQTTARLLLRALLTCPAACCRLCALWCTEGPVVDTLSMLVLLPLMSFWFCCCCWPPPTDEVDAAITSCPSTASLPPPPPPRVVMGDADADVVGVPPLAAAAAEDEDGGFAAAEAGVLRVASFTSLNFSMNCKTATLVSNHPSSRHYLWKLSTFLKY